MPELDKWGIGMDHPDMAQVLIYSSSCLWTTIRSAEFKRKNDPKNIQFLKELQEKQGELVTLQKKLAEKRREIYEKFKGEIKGSVWREIYGKDEPPFNVPNEEYKALKEIGNLLDKYNYQAHTIAKGALSPSFAASLIYCLEQSLKKHTGD